MKTTIISVFIGAMLVFTPLTASATTIQELQAQISNLLTLVSSLQQQLKQTTSKTKLFVNTRDNYQVTIPKDIKLVIAPPNASENPVLLGSASELGYISKVTIFSYNGTIDQTKKAFADSYKNMTVTFGQDVSMIINGNQARKVTAYFDGKGSSPVYYIQYEPNRTLIVHSSEDVAKSVKTLSRIKPNDKISSCININNNLWVGKHDSNTNGEVSKLQLFLLKTGDYSYGTITGYYGPATERAVQRWQKVNGVASSGTPNSTGYGIVGPKTRDRIGCGVSKISPQIVNNIPTKTSLQSVYKQTIYIRGGSITMEMPQGWVASKIGNKYVFNAPVIGNGGELFWPLKGREYGSASRDTQNIRLRNGSIVIKNKIWGIQNTSPGTGLIVYSYYGAGNPSYPQKDENFDMYIYFRTFEQRDRFEKMFDSSVRNMHFKKSPEVRPTCDLTAQPRSVVAGKPVLLKWTSENAISANLNPTYGAVSLNGSRTVTIGDTGKTQTINFGLTVSGSGGNTTCYAPITVTSPHINATATIYNSSLNTLSGGKVTIKGSALNLDRVLVVIVKPSHNYSSNWKDTYTSRSYVSFTRINPYVINGRWTASFNNIPSGTYTVLVYTGITNDASVPQQLLTNGVLSVKGSPSISITNYSIGVSSARMSVLYDYMPAASVRILNESNISVWTQELTLGGGGSTVVSLPQTLPAGYYRAQAFGPDAIYATSKKYYLSSSEVNFVAGQNMPITLKRGQVATDGGIRIKFLSTAIESSSGLPVANLYITPNGYNGSFYKGYAGKIVGFFVHPTHQSVIVKVSSIDIQNDVVRLNIIIDSKARG